jgi:hypothetical protein
MCDDDYDDDEDDRVMLVPEFEEDGVAGGGKIFFIPFESGSGDIPLLAQSNIQTQLFINHAPKVDQDPTQAQGEGGEEPSTDDTQEDPDPHDHDPPSPAQSGLDAGTPEEGHAKGEQQSSQHTTTEARSGDGTEMVADGEGIKEGEEDGKDQSPRLPTETREESSVQQPRTEESDETTNTKGETSSTLSPDGLLANFEPSEQVQQVVHVGIIAIHTDSNGHGAAALREHARKDLEEPWASIVPPSTERAADQTTELAGHLQQQEIQDNAKPVLATAAATTSTTAMTREQRRRDKGKEKLLDVDEGDNHNHDHSVSVDAAARITADQRRGEVRRATVLPRPLGGSATVDGGGAKKEWVWDREHVSPRERLSSSSGAAQTRSPREGLATKRSPLLLRDEPPVAVAATSCLSCTLS